MTHNGLVTATAFVVGFTAAGLAVVAIAVRLQARRERRRALRIARWVPLSPKMARAMSEQAAILARTGISVSEVTRRMVEANERLYPKPSVRNVERDIDVRLVPRRDLPEAGYAVGDGAP
jgi:hypothetical protein